MSLGSLQPVADAQQIFIPPGSHFPSPAGVRALRGRGGFACLSLLPTVQQVSGDALTMDVPFGTCPPDSCPEYSFPFQIQF